MMKPTLIISTLVVTLFLSSSFIATAQPQQVYGNQFMTQQEMFEFHERMRNARSFEEQEQMRNEHHQRMQARAQAQGYSLPDRPPYDNTYRRMGPGHMGPGYMGPGHMGPGYMGPGYMRPQHMMPGYMGPGGCRRP